MVHQARSCLAVLSLSISLSCIAGCGASQPSVVGTRASREHGCPREQVVIEELGGSSYRAKGCGQTATYTCLGGNAGNPFDAMCTKEGTH